MQKIGKSIYVNFCWFRPDCSQRVKVDSHHYYKRDVQF